MWPEIWSLRYAILYTHVQYHLNKSQFFFHGFVNENHGNCAEYLTCAYINFTIGFICICVRPKFLKYVQKNPHSVFLNSRFYHNVQFCLLKVCNLGIEFHLCKILVKFVLKCADPQRRLNGSFFYIMYVFQFHNPYPCCFKLIFLNEIFILHLYSKLQVYTELSFFNALSTILLTQFHY